MKIFLNNVTVFVITTGTNINYLDCINSLKNQTVDFKVDIIKNYSPLSVAFQQMLGRCTTEFFIQVDEDMILYENAIENLYNFIQQNSNNVMVSCKLLDIHYQIPITGIKIYKTNIFKYFPYNIHSPSCEVEQLERVIKKGYQWLEHQEIVGQHSPKWTTYSIFERYNNLIKKQNFLGGPCGFGDIPLTLSKKLSQEFNNYNFFALLGAMVAKHNKLDIFKGEKDFTKIHNSYQLFKEQFPDMINDYQPLKILFLYDVDGWVFDFETRNYQKFSSHTILRKKFDEITFQDLDNINILLIPGSCHYKFLKDKGIINQARTNKIKIVVQYNSEIELDLQRFITDCDLAIASSPTIRDRLMASGQRNLIFFPHFVDTDYWEDTSSQNKFVIGWVGNPNCKVKNHHFLKELNYPIIEQSKYGEEYFIKDRSLQEMKDFYAQIGILIILSESEGTPMPLLEAMASGKVVLATDTGIAPLILNQDCLINRHKDIVKQLNKKLEYLKNNQHLLNIIGNQNRLVVREKLDWFKHVTRLDKIYKDLINGKHFK